MDIINVNQLAKRFGNLIAVDDISFQVEKGEIFGFLGPNGAGKTTTISMLCTLLKPSSGTATVGGFDIVRAREDVRRSIGLVFQDSSLDEYLTAEQNLLFHAYAYNVPRTERKKRIDELLELVGLAERRKSKVSTFSGVMKRRLEIARGLLHHPDVYSWMNPLSPGSPDEAPHLGPHLKPQKNQRPHHLPYHPLHG
jgi:ABC-2 type transport system ATP-binding protein